MQKNIPIILLCTLLFQATHAYTQPPKLPQSKLINFIKKHKIALGSAAGILVLAALAGWHYHHRTKQPTSVPASTSPRRLVTPDPVPPILNSDDRPSTPTGDLLTEPLHIPSTPATIPEREPTPDDRLTTPPPEITDPSPTLPPSPHTSPSTSPRRLVTPDPVPPIINPDDRPSTPTGDLLTEPLRMPSPADIQPTDIPPDTAQPADVPPAIALSPWEKAQTLHDQGFVLPALAMNDEPEPTRNEHSCRCAQCCPPLPPPDAAIFSNPEEVVRLKNLHGILEANGIKIPGVIWGGDGLGLYWACGICQTKNYGEENPRCRTCYGWLCNTTLATRWPCARVNSPFTKRCNDPGHIVPYLDGSKYYKASHWQCPVDHTYNDEGVSDPSEGRTYRCTSKNNYGAQCLEKRDAKIRPLNWYCTTCQHHNSEYNDRCTGRDPRTKNECMSARSDHGAWSQESLISERAKMAKQLKYQDIDYFKTIFRPSNSVTVAPLASIDTVMATPAAHTENYLAIEVPASAVYSVQGDGYCGWRAISGYFNNKNPNITYFYRIIRPSPGTGSHWLDFLELKFVSQLLKRTIIVLKPFGHSERSLLFNIHYTFPIADAEGPPIIIIHNGHKRTGGDGGIHFDRVIIDNTYERFIFPEVFPLAETTAAAAAETTAAAEKAEAERLATIHNHIVAETVQLVPHTKT